VTVIRPGKGDKPTISKGKGGYRVTRKKPEKFTVQKELEKDKKAMRKMNKLKDL